MTSQIQGWTVGRVGRPLALSSEKVPQVNEYMYLTCTYVFGSKNERDPVQPSNPSNPSNIRPRITPTKEARP